METRKGNGVELSAGGEPLSQLESSDYKGNSRRGSGLLKPWLIAAASAAVAGVAAAWWYRKTLTRLRETEEAASDSYFGISGDEPGEDS